MVLFKNIKVFIRYYWRKLALQLTVILHLFFIGLFLIIYIPPSKVEIPVNIDWTPSTCKFVGYNFTIHDDMGRSCNISANPYYTDSCRAYALVLGESLNASVCSNNILTYNIEYYNPIGVNFTRFASAIETQYPVNKTINCSINKDCKTFQDLVPNTEMENSFLAFLVVFLGVSSLTISGIILIYSLGLAIKDYQEIQASGLLGRLNTSSSDNSDNAAYASL